MREKFRADLPLTEEEAERAVEIVEKRFMVLEWSSNRKFVELITDLSGDVETKFRETMRDLKEEGFILVLDERDGEGLMKVGKYSEPEGGASTTHYILFAATILTTLTAGALMFGVDVFSNPLSIWRGWPFSAAILLILGSHEFGHFFLSSERDVVATPPYFIPVPPPFILGTLGAVIRMKSPIPDRRALIDIGAAGPILGVVFAIPVTLLGLYLSPIPVPGEGQVLRLGNPLIFQALTYILPVSGEGGLHPVAFAGWVGFFVTFLNLLPVGQLDGGHVTRALVGDYHQYISGAVPFVLMAMGFYFSFLTGTGGGQIWIFWGFITLFFHGGGHPPPLNQVSKLTLKRRIFGVLLYALMLACFTPVPFTFGTA